TAATSNRRSARRGSRRDRRPRATSLHPSSPSASQARSRPRARTRSRSARGSSSSGSCTRPRTRPRPRTQRHRMRTALSARRHSTSARLGEHPLTRPQIARAWPTRVPTEPARERQCPSREIEAGVTPGTCEHTFVTKEATILHADVDSFFAAVEQRDDPQLRGQPVIVGAWVVLAASYEAKAHGVRTAMSVTRARRLSPGATVVEPRMSAYAEASKAVYRVFDDTTPLVEGMSIDEAFLDVRGLG